MRIHATDLSRDHEDVDAICIGVLDPPGLPDKLDRQLLEAIDPLIQTKEADGKHKHVAVARRNGVRLLLVGLGEEDALDAERMREASAVALRELSRLRSKKATWRLPGAAMRPDLVAAVAEGAELAAYRFSEYKSKDDDPDEGTPPDIEILADSDAAASVEGSLIAARASNAARDLQNQPPNTATPAYLAERAERLARELPEIAVGVLDETELSALAMGGVLAVGRGSVNQPRVITMRYRGSGGRGETLGLVGKGITFDSGGISIKPSSKMWEMKMDMSGAAAVIEAVGAICRLGLPIDVIAVVPCAENMPGGNSYRPGDVVKTYGGKTVEILNTDAEGRVVLADALTYAVELGADRIVDIATLTGAVVISLGSTYAGLMSNDDALAASILRAGDATGERVWRLPIHREYLDLTKSAVADLANASTERKAGSCYAATFLEQFVDGRPWAHLDIAGTAWDTGREYMKKGATGFGVRLIVEAAIDLAAA